MISRCFTRVPKLVGLGERSLYHGLSVFTFNLYEDQIIHETQKIFTYTTLKSIIVEYTNHGGAEDQDHV